MIRLLLKNAWKFNIRSTFYRNTKRKSHQKQHYRGRGVKRYIFSYKILTAVSLQWVSMLTITTLSFASVSTCKLKPALQNSTATSWLLCLCCSDCFNRGGKLPAKITEAAEQTELLKCLQNMAYGLQNVSYGPNIPLLLWVTAGPLIKFSYTTDLTWPHKQLCTNQLHSIEVISDLASLSDTIFILSFFLGQIRIYKAMVGSKQFNNPLAAGQVHLEKSALYSSAVFSVSHPKRTSPIC